jgi:lipopolysaccharide/colanic/teichoic acid biosynthesis glycosyltransferase
MDDCTFEIGPIAGRKTVDMTSNSKQRGGTSMQGKTNASGYFARKVWPSRIVGAVLLVLASPIILLLVLLVRLTSSGPGIYRQVRTGRHGSDFNMYKVRTMYDGAEAVSGPVWCRPGDSRITPIGKVLRLLHLDELPQLINVARGEMDLIGPRPERPEFVARLARSIPNYHARLQVLPGVTGLAQVNLPPDESLDSVRSKLVLDCTYIREANASLDLRILLCAVRWLRLERDVPLTYKDNHPSRQSTPHWMPPADCQIEEDFYVGEHVNGVAFAPAMAGENGSTSPATSSIAGGDSMLRRRLRH